MVNRDGTEIATADEETRPALEPDIADEVAGLLRGAVQDGTGTPARVAGAEVLGKTGTTDRGADAWFVGGDESLMAAVWVGDPQGRITQPNATGATVAAPLCREAIGNALSDHSS